MKNKIKCSVWVVAVFSLQMGLWADPSFVTSTFDAGSEGWQPWATSGVNGLSPGDPHLNIAADGVGVYGKMITFNKTPEWTGDYYSAGVTGIQLDISNTSSSDTVFLRVAVGNRASPQQSGGTWFISQSAVVVPTLSGWTNVFLPLTESDLTIVGNLPGEIGTDSYETTFGNILNIRILSAAIPLGAIGDEFVGDVGIDNVALIPEPAALSMIGLGAAVLALHRKRSGKLWHLQRHN